MLVVWVKVILIYLYFRFAKLARWVAVSPTGELAMKKTANFHQAAVKRGSTASLFVAQNAAVVYRKASSQRPTDEYVLHRHS